MRTEPRIPRNLVTFCGTRNDCVPEHVERERLRFKGGGSTSPMQLLNLEWGKCKPQELHRTLSRSGDLRNAFRNTFHSSYTYDVSFPQAGRIDLPTYTLCNRRVTDVGCVSYMQS